MGFRFSGCLSLNVLSWWFCDRAFFLYYKRAITILSRTFIHCLTGCLSSIVCKFRNEITTPFISTLGKTHARIAIFCKNSTRLFLPILAILQSFLPSLSCWIHVVSRGKGSFTYHNSPKSIRQHHNSWGGRWQTERLCAVSVVAVVWICSLVCSAVKPVYWIWKKYLASQSIGW